MTSLKSSQRGRTAASASTPSPSTMSTTTSPMLVPIVEITRLRTPTVESSGSALDAPPLASATLPMTATVKREEGANEEIKEFAETAMNELLGWYGYGTPTTSVRKSNGLQGRVHPERDSVDRESWIRNRQDSMGISEDIRPQMGRSHSPPSPRISPSRNTPNPEGSSSNNLVISCDWCHRNITKDVSQTFGTTEGVRFCSESCFSQSRRATFKRAKTCDWCRHVRHAVSYVDFQDGASQLQFCSDKCLNQYKMQIFIKETQAHLEMNPHLMDKSEECAGNLITPELWLKNCKSRSVSPEPRSGSESESPNPLDIRRTSRMALLQQSLSAVTRPQITLAPVSKLVAPVMVSETQTEGGGGGGTSTGSSLTSRPSMKTMRKRRTLRNGPPVRDNPTSFLQQRIPTEHHVGSSRVNVPKLLSRTEGLNNNRAATEVQSQENFVEERFLPHVTPTNTPFPTRPSFLQQPQLVQNIGLTQGRSQPPHQNNAQVTQGGSSSGLFSSLIPPHLSQVTVLVPCPIIIPIPVPIPIPVNIPEFLLKHCAGLSNQRGSPSTSAPANESKSSGAFLRDPEKDVNNNKEGCTGQGIGEEEEEDGSGRGSHRNGGSDLNVTDDDEDGEEDEQEAEGGPAESEVVPKIKITRLQSKRLLTTRELDRTRPLRKRKRIVVDTYT